MAIPAFMRFPTFENFDSAPTVPGVVRRWFVEEMLKPVAIFHGVRVFWLT